MIFVSTACIKAKTMREVLTTLGEAGFRYVELSSGTPYYEGLQDDLLALRQRYGFTYLVHNYFPPGRDPFVINLASLNDEVHLKSIAQLQRGIDMCRLLGADRFSFHAGFFLDPKVSELGQELKARPLFDRRQATDRYCQGFAAVENYAGPMPLYIENNNLMPSVFENFAPHLPLMLLTSDDYQELRARIKFKPLLDVAHLRAACTAIGRDFMKEVRPLLQDTDYLHVGDSDDHFRHERPLSPDAPLLKMLQDLQLKGKILTLEVQGTVADLKSSYRLLEDVVA